VDVLFFDTASTYFVTEDEDEPVARDDHGMPLASGNPGSSEDGDLEPQPSRTWGKSRDHRDDLPQVVIGTAVTRDGIPARVWCRPGDTSDSALTRQVRDDVRDWSLSKVTGVAGRGFTSAENRRYLRKGGGSYIIGEKLRSGSADAAAALSGQGRYKDAAGNPKAKEVRVSDEERFVICFNPEAAEKDAAVRARMTARLEETIRDADQLSRDKRAELRGVISTRPGTNRYLRVTPGGLLRTDAAKAKAEENLDGKNLLRKDLARAAPRARQDPRQHLHRPRRHLSAAHRAHQTAPRHPQGPANRRPATRPPAETPCRSLTRRDPAAQIHERNRRH
jgi:hypothetical protein